MKVCKSCALISRRNQGTAPFWDCIYRTSLWDVAHCYETSLPGWLILIVRRHIQSLDELTISEAVELGQLIRNTSSAIKAVTGCIKTYVLQFAESPDHPHVHFHIIPRMADLPENYRSTQIFKYLGVPGEERVSEEAMNGIASKVREILLANAVA
jgi:diadenosine tetraphosphate (Ap4A) HIT family hydrolase